MSETKDHYVPESYLQNFCTADSKLNVYNKDTKMAFPNPTHCKKVVNQIVLKMPNQYQNRLEQMALNIKTKVIQSTINSQRWLSTEGISIVQEQDIFKFCHDIGKILLNHYWLIGVNTFGAEKDFYTSDHPVSQHGYDEAAGLGSKGVEIVFPLSSKVILILREKEYFQEYINFDNKILPLTTEQIDYYNSLQVTSSDRFVYCRDRDFRLVEHTIETNHYDLSSNRKRFKVTYQN